ncbi:hypothetical protein AOLI_G00153320 [Acnodon oligacanthus]
MDRKPGRERRESPATPPEESHRPNNSGGARRPGARSATCRSGGGNSARLVAPGLHYICTERRRLGQRDGPLLADRGYPCMPHVRTPYPDPEPGPQSRHNPALSKQARALKPRSGFSRPGSRACGGSGSLQRGHVTV